MQRTESAPHHHPRQRVHGAQEEESLQESFQSQVKKIKFQRTTTSQLLVIETKCNSVSTEQLLLLLVVVVLVLGMNEQRVHRATINIIIIIIIIINISSSSSSSISISIRHE